MKLKRQVVMLPTNEKAIIDKGSIVLYKKLSPTHDDDIDKPVGSLLTSVRTVPNSEWWEKQHLYITSDEEIKEGDWCIQNGNYLCKITCNHDRTQQGLKKIIATTDKSIAIQHDTLSIPQRKGLINHYPTEKVILPTVSNGFIRKFIEKYNAGNPITEVMVEYEEYPITTYGMSDGEPETDTRLKVDKNNCITIRPVKESWTREELPIEVMKDMLRYCEVNQIYDKLSNFGDFYYKGKKWIEQNL